MRGQKKSFNETLRKKIFDKYRYMCANRDAPKCLVNKGLEIHHIIANTKMNMKFSRETTAWY